MSYSFLYLAFYMPDLHEPIQVIENLVAFNWFVRNDIREIMLKTTNYCYEHTERQQSQRGECAQFHRGVCYSYKDALGKCIVAIGLKYDLNIDRQVFSHLRHLLFTNELTKECLQVNLQDSLYKIGQTVNDVKSILKQNIDKVLERQENIDVLLIKTEDLCVGTERLRKKVKPKCCIFM